MPITVVDASAIAAILFSEAEGDAMTARLSGHRLAAPALIDLEIANICVTRARRDPSSAASLPALLGVFAGLSIRHHPVAPDGVLRLALSNRLTAYDAAYLWLARHLGAPLVTLDARLAAASA